MDTDKIILDEFITHYPAEAVRAIERLSIEEMAAFMEQIPLSLNINLLKHANTYIGAKCLQSISADLAKELIENTEISIAEALLRQCETSFRFKLLDKIDPKLAATLREKLEYDADTVGALMIPRVFALRKSTSVIDALEIVKLEIGRISSVVYVIDEQDKLKGKIMLHELFFADTSKYLHEITNPEIPKFAADMSIKSIVDHPGWHTHRSIPVIDRSEKLIGVLTFAAIQQNKGNKGRELTKEVLETSNSLGELYRIGLTGFLQSISK